MPIGWAAGHVVVSGEALALNNASLFAFNSPVPSATAVAEIRALGPALSHVRAVTCEGDTDFGGIASHQQELSVARARAICTMLHSDHADIRTTSLGYGGTDPVIVGGNVAGRVQNRRVDIVVTASTPVYLVPTAPHLWRAVAGDTTATITFSKPAETGGKKITGYRVSINGGKTWRAVATTAEGPYTSVLTGLTDGTTYSLAVRAVNALGQGPASNRLQVTPRSAATVPSAPDLTAVTAGDTTATVAFSAPVSNGGAEITGYEISADAGTTWTHLTTTGVGPYAATLIGLTDGTTYPLTVRAVNAVGDGAASNSRNVTPLGVPAPPVITAGEFHFVDYPGPSEIVLSFTSPASDGGTPITGYLISESEANYQTLVYVAGAPNTAQEPVPFCTFGSFTFTIEAINAVGRSRPSNTVSVNTDVGAPNIGSDRLSC